MVFGREKDVRSWSMVDLVTVCIYDHFLKFACYGPSLNIIKRDTSKSIVDRFGLCPIAFGPVVDVKDQFS